MKLQTSIKPRRDGTLRVSGQDSQTFVFAPGPDGELVCDVTDEALVAQLIGTDNFWPADPDDYDAALKLASAESDDGADDSDDVDSESDPALNALPVEAETPPAAPNKRKTKAA